jgi:hypothetical protein
MFESTSFEVVFLMAELAIIVDSDISFVIMLHNGHPFSLLACLVIIYTMFPWSKY